MTEDKLKEFLKAYADAANDIELLREFAPLSMTVNMAGAQCNILDKNRNVLAITRHQGEWIPSMPVQPQQIGFAKLFVKAANMLLTEEDS